jgi:hypothetical protein
MRRVLSGDRVYQQFGHIFPNPHVMAEREANCTILADVVWKVTLLYPSNGRGHRHSK